MSIPKQKLDELLELANHYPSPHNGQPIRLKQTGDRKFDVYFEKSRGLQSTDISLLFSFVSMGVFMEHLVSSAEALGHKCTYSLHLPKQAELKGEDLVKFASCSVAWDAKQRNEPLLRALEFRQTSRKKYHEGIGTKLAARLTDIARDQGMKLTLLNAAQTKQAIWLNQRAVFDDMFDEAVRQELDHWLRYSQAEKQTTKDGLAYDCMELNGRVMKYIVNHPKVLRKPGISKLIEQYYLRTMTDNSDVLYMLAPFGREQQAFEIGLVIMKLWQEVAASGRYLHPFGTIMSNQAAHQDFLKLANVKHESRDKSYLVFIFRCGKSDIPAGSLRLPYQQHLIME